MKKTISIVLVVFLVFALAATVFAVDMQTGAIGIVGRKSMLTEEEKAALEAKKSELLNKYNALPEDQKTLIKEMVGTLSPFDLMTDAEKAAKKAEMEAKQEARKAELDAKYKTLTASQKAIVDEIKSLFGLPKKDLTNDEKKALMEKRQALMQKIQALSDTDKEALRDFFPMKGKEFKGGKGFVGGRENMDQSKLVPQNVNT